MDDHKVFADEPRELNMLGGHLGRLEEHILTVILQCLFKKSDNAYHFFP
jgi:hypothetical protein